MFFLSSQHRRQPPTSFPPAYFLPGFNPPPPPVVPFAFLGRKLGKEPAFEDASFAYTQPAFDPMGLSGLSTKLFANKDLKPMCNFPQFFL